jgi:hypothetical protein
MGCDILNGREIAGTVHRRGKVVTFGGCQAHFSSGQLGGVTDSIVCGYPGPRNMAGILEDMQKGSLVPEYDEGNDLNFAFDYSMLVGRMVKPSIGKVKS